MESQERRSQETKRVLKTILRLPGEEHGSRSFTLGFTFLDERGVEDVQSVKASLFQFEAVQRSGARDVPNPQHPDLRV